MLTISCIREPELHLPNATPSEIEFSIVDLDLKTMWKYTWWDYALQAEVDYDWRTEWLYGWDATDIYNYHSDSIGYSPVDFFSLLRYYTGQIPMGPHTSRPPLESVRGNTYTGKFNKGFWDILVWSDVDPEKVSDIALDYDYESSNDSVVDSTDVDRMHFATPTKPRRIYYQQPEQLFSAYSRGEEINEEKLEDYKYDSIRNVWIRELEMKLEPITYIYLVQLILWNNNDKISFEGPVAGISNFASSTNVNTGVASTKPIDVDFSPRQKKSMPVPRTFPSEIFRDSLDKMPKVTDVVGARMLTFGICGQNGNRIDSLQYVKDKYKHELYMPMKFSNGVDSTFVFDVTEKVRSRWKGGVISVELDMSKIPMPQRSGGSAFDAVVEEYKDTTYVFDM